MTSLPYTDARAWAEDQSLANVPRLARLESVAFQRHPDVVAGFGADGASFAARLRPVPAMRRGAGALFVLLGLCGAVAPLAGVAFYAVGLSFFSLVEPLPASTAVPAAGICFAIAAVMQALLWIVWIRDGAHWSPGVLGLAATAAVMAAFALAGVPTVAARDAFDASGWIWPVAATVVLAGALCVAILLRRGSPAPVREDPLPAAPTLSDRERSRVRVQDIGAPELAVIRDDRDDALRILHRRGLIDEDTLNRALSADLGTLFAMDPVRSEE
ncbi:MAG: hypothetical protein JST25_10405 [Actinobacteria bacterium]|nr:hypothetical protein [Actinomycetota bacterium]